jgi:hypothetical protein
MILITGAKGQPGRVVGKEVPAAAPSRDNPDLLDKLSLNFTRICRTRCT